MKFSVAMSVYKKDNADYFERALWSITENQTVLPNEIVLVVDGEVPEKLNKVIAGYEKNYNIFKVIRLPENKGLGNALKIALENCTFEIVARMDSDDVAVSNRFEEQLKYFENYSDLDIVGSDISEFIDLEDNIVAKRVVPKTNEEIAKYLKRRCPMNHVSVMYKKSSVLKAGGYLDFLWNEDYYLWIRMYQNKCVFMNSPTVWVNVRVGQDMYRRRGGWKYFKSERRLQKYMKDNKIIGFFTYFINVAQRFMLQVLMPNWLRGWVFKKFARTREKE